jgi:hypothetical protein
MYQFESILQVHTVYVEDFKLPVACVQCTCSHILLLSKEVKSCKYRAHKMPKCSKKYTFIM